MNNLFLTVLNLSFICSLLIILIIFMDKFFCKNYSRRWKYIVWFMIAIRLILPIHFNFVSTLLPDNAIYSFVEDSSTNFNTSSDVIQKEEFINSNSVNLNRLNQKDDTIQKDDTKQIDDTNQADGIVLSNELNSKENDSINTNNFWFHYIAIAWIVGAFLYLTYHFFAYYSFLKRLNRWSISVTNVKLLDLFQNICNEYGVKRPFKLMKSNQVTSPILVGFFRPTIVLPEKEFTLEQYSFILKHEIIHYKHHDLYYKMILLFANAMHWFNPLIYYMVLNANTDMELYCDEKLIDKNDLYFRKNYSMTILQIMVAGSGNKSILLTTNFSGKKNQVKNRFTQIMHVKPKKKGTFLLVCFLFLLLLFSNWMGGLQSNQSKAENIHTKSDKEASITKSSTITNNDVKNNQTSHILIVGIDSSGTNDKNARADSILLVSVNSVSKQVYLTSFLRDIYIEVPNYGKNKLSVAYKLGGIGLMKKTIETNFEFSIDHTITLPMIAFENLINSIGGVEVELSKEEVQYLNSTNYISKKTYRTLRQGLQRLNGNQALGYVRIRNVSTSKGKNGDIGRTARLRNLISQVIEEYSKKDLSQLIKLYQQNLAWITTDLTYDDIISYTELLLNKVGINQTSCIPEDGTYTQDVVDGMSVMVPDLKKNVEELKRLFP